ncbi:MAG: hypothetical protein IPL59_00555 [Candidatus Competibacteraceae bacterium]|nr:hypothetical protein [Candidatus Competibacteraceae bacterium]
MNYRSTQTPPDFDHSHSQSPDLIQSRLDSLLARTRYPHFEVLIVDNRSDEPAVLITCNSKRERMPGFE